MRKSKPTPKPTEGVSPKQGRMVSPTDSLEGRKNDAMAKQKGAGVKERATPSKGGAVKEEEHNFMQDSIEENIELDDALPADSDSSTSEEMFSGGATRIP